MRKVSVKSPKTEHTEHSNIGEPLRTKAEKVLNEQRREREPILRTEPTAT